ncbi:MAG TPA: nitroreductase family protein [Acidimicrobiales bacterium]|nr:nitroreductase family protein [Acidimicrobiales bacterium]
MDTPFDLEITDALLSTTRAVRKRLDLDRPVERQVLLDCVRISQQAPTGSNTQGWRWLMVTEAGPKAALADMYRRAGGEYLKANAASIGDQKNQLSRVLDSASYLAENLERVPVLVIPCIQGRLPASAPAGAWAGFMGSIFPAVWSFQLALRARGLGSALTTFHLAFESQAAELLGIPADVTQVGLLPVAYTKGTDFRPADRPPPEHIVSWERWGNKEERS